MPVGDRRTPDKAPGPRYEEELRLQDQGTDPEEIGAIRRVGSDIKAVDGTGLFNLRSGSGLTAGEHEVLDTLVHDLAETSYLEIVRSDGLVTDLIYWTDNGKTTKVREVSLTRTGNLVSQVVKRQYDALGVLAHTLTGTINRALGRVTSIDWVKS